VLAVAILVVLWSMWRLYLVIERVAVVSSSWFLLYLDLGCPMAPVVFTSVRIWCNECVELVYATALLCASSILNRSDAVVNNSGRLPAQMLLQVVHSFGAGGIAL